VFEGLGTVVTRLVLIRLIGLSSGFSKGLLWKGTWPSVGGAGPLWERLGICGRGWAFMGGAGPLWEEIGLYESSWACVGRAGLLWEGLGFCERSWAP